MKTLAILITTLFLSTGVIASEQACLAAAIHNEAKGEDLKGQLLVASVIFNRIDSADFPDTICSVVKQPGQFDTRPVTTQEESYIVAGLILEGELVPPKTSALYFHSGPKPSYLGGKKFLFQHGDHFFYGD